MPDQKFSLNYFVSSRQNPRKPTLRKVMDYHYDDIEPVEHDISDDHAVKLDDDLYLWEKKEDLPDELPKANYVIIDVMYFSTTGIEIMAGGAKKLKIRKNHEEIRELGLNSSGIKLGGEGTSEHRPREGMDFYNSPSFVQELDLEGHEVAMTSDNGAVAAMKVKEAQPDANVYLGSTTNALAVARKIRDDYRDIHIVCSGSSGGSRAEDHIGAFLIARYLKRQQLDDNEMEQIEKLLTGMEMHHYEDTPDVRQEDIKAYIANVNSREEVPELVEDEDGYSFVLSDDS